MKAADADVVWTPRWASRHGKQCPMTGTVRVERRLSGWARTPGDLWVTPDRAFDFYSGKLTPDKRLLSIFILFNTLTVRDGIDPLAAHEAFLEIDEYRESISPDIPETVVMKTGSSN